MNKILTFFVLVFFSFSLMAGVPKEISPKWFQFLKELVEINSATENTKGLDKAWKKVSSEFKKMGFIPKVNDLAQGHKIVSFEMKNATPKILMIGHLDTVFPVHSEFQKFSAEANELIGPGVMDMKGGIVMMLNLLDEIKDKKILKQLRVVINDDEEIGSKYSSDKMREIGKGIPYGFVYEPGFDDGGVIISHSGVQWLEVKVTGKAAHAGADFKQGLNACLALSYKLPKIAALTDFERNLTVNVGTLEGGIKANVVCEKASAKIDIRYVDPKDLQKTMKEIEKIIKGPDAFNDHLEQAPSSEMISLVYVPSMTKDSTDDLFGVLQEIAKELGQSVPGRHASFASDANQLAPIGMKLLVSLGPCGSYPHTNKESLKLSSYPERLKLNLALIKKVLK